MGRIVKIILSWCLVIAVPVVSLGLACNALVRLPDLYQYTMNDTQLLRSFNAQGQEEAVAQDGAVDVAQGTFARFKSLGNSIAKELHMERKTVGEAPVVLHSEQLLLLLGYQQLELLGT